MTYKEFYNQQDSWSKKVLIIDLFHNKMLLKHGSKWNIRRTAKSLRLSVGLISEGLKLAKAVKEDRLIDCKNRKEALIKLRELDEN